MRDESRCRCAVRCASQTGHTEDPDLGHIGGKVALLADQLQMTGQASEHYTRAWRAFAESVGAPTSLSPTGGSPDCGR
jgi:hypothetical protein